MHQITYIVFLQKKMAHGYGIEDFVIFICNIYKNWIENNWLKDNQNLSLRRIKCVKHAKRESKLRSL